MVIRLLILLVVVATGACTSLAPVRTAPPDGAHLAAAPVGAPDVRFWGDDLSAAQVAEINAILRNNLSQQWRAAGSPASGVDEHILALSGGGPDGAFAAGLLTGWSQRGDRPSFAIVTGISVGALIAPFAFAGADYDDALRQIFTETETSDIAQLALFSMLRGALAIADTAPLRARIRSLVDEALLARIADGHRAGRRLLVGTTNLDAGRPVLWDLGEIAMLGQTRLFEDVLLASASIPGAFPPVMIEVDALGERFSELHVDGGVTQSVFLGPTGVQLATPTDLSFPVRRTIYVIQNNGLTPPYDPVSARITSIVSRSVSTLIRAQSEGDLRRIYDIAEDVGAEFRLAFVPPGFGAASAASFDRVYMTALFEHARALSFDGVDWLSAPPGVLSRSDVEAALTARRAQRGLDAPAVAAR